MDVVPAFELDGIQLSTQAITAELYSTAYTPFEILLLMPQNYSPAAYALRGFGGVAMESVRFADEEIAKLFDIEVLDDRSVMLVPTDYAVENGKSLKSKYTSGLIVTVAGREYPTAALTVNLKNPHLNSKPQWQPSTASTPARVRKS